MNEYYISEPKIVNINNKNDDWIIPLITVIIILIVASLFIWVMKKDKIPQSKITINECGVGQCATNFYNGIKRCPIDKEVVEYDITTEVCNSRYICDDPATGFAVLSNGGTLKNGLHVGNCEEGVECRCVRNPQCPNFVTAYFHITGGTSFTEEDGTTLSYNQSIDYKLPYGVSGESGSQATDKSFNIPPLVLPDAQLDVCTVGISALDIIYPSTCVRGALGEILDNNGNSQTYRQFACLQERIICPASEIIAISENGSIVKCVTL